MTSLGFYGSLGVFVDAWLALGVAELHDPAVVVFVGYYSLPSNYANLLIDLGTVAVFSGIFLNVSDAAGIYDFLTL